MLLRWTAISVLAGAIGASVVAGFRWCLEAGQSMVASLSLPPPLIALVAALLVGLVIYRIAPDAAGEGIPSYLHALNRDRSRFLLSATIWKLPAALLTFVGYGSGGLVGPLGRATAGILSRIASRFTGRLITDRDRRTAALCGMAAAVSSLFGVPLGGGIFAVEIIQKANMHYSDLFPCILAGSTAVWLSAVMGWEPLFTVPPVRGAISPSMLPWMLLLAVIVGLAGGAFTRAYTLTVRIFRRDRGRVALKVAIGMVSAATLVWVVNPGLFDTAIPVIDGAISGDAPALRGALPPQTPLVVAVVVMLLVRALASCLTIGSGMSAGLMGPAIALGILAGAAFSLLLGLPPGGANYLALLAAGFAGMLASSMNVPIAAAVMTVEIFGLAFSLPAGIAAVIGFQINRHQTIYDFAIAGSGHIEEHWKEEEEAHGASQGPAE